MLNHQLSFILTKKDAFFRIACQKGGVMIVYPFVLDQNESDLFLKRMNVSTSGIAIMKERFRNICYVVKDIPSPAANVVKQHLLSLGGEAAVPRHSVNCSEERSDLIFSLREDLLPRLLARLRQQCWGLPTLADKIEFSRKLRSPWFGFSLDDFSVDKPAVMGILNATPDSFSDGGKFDELSNAIQHADRMIADGVDIIDIGGESTRPGSLPVEESEEIKRTAPVISEIKKINSGIKISIDTMKSAVAEKALQAGATIINDVSGLRHSPDMAKVAADYNAAIVIMHMKGSPKDMQKSPVYEEVIDEIVQFFEESLEHALRCGVDESKIILDPGIGFGKTLQHNLFITRHFRSFTGLGFPVLMALSRKSFIGKITGRENPVERLAGTIALNTMALEQGAAAIRVHDVKEGRDTVDLFRSVSEVECC